MTLRKRLFPVVLLLAPAYSLVFADSPHKKPIAAPADGVCGQLSEFGGLRVLELWGDAEQAGYAHGRLLGRELVRLFDDYVLAPRTIEDPRLWDAAVLPRMHALFDWPDDALRELEAMHRGLADAVGEEGLRSKRLNRALSVEDLMAINAFADLHAFMCSSFTAWGDWTADGETITGRNLDFPSTPEMERAQIIVIRHAHGEKPALAGVTWPGAVGVYTAMSSRGVTMLMHDAPGLEPTQRSGFTPRALILREALEAARPASYARDVEAVFRKRRVLVGNNIHVSVARKAANGAAPATVFEFDANGETGGGVTARTAASTEGGPRDVLWCTNHMCARRPARECRRFEQLQAFFDPGADSPRPLTTERVFQLLHDVRQDMTLHSVWLKPSTLEMRVRIPAVTGLAPVAFDLAAWFDGPLTAPAARRGAGGAAGATAAGP